MIATYSNGSGPAPQQPEVGQPSIAILERALGQLKDRAKAYQKYQLYYDGIQPLAYATSKFRNAFGSLFQEFAYNLCPMVVDALSERLHVSGFEVETDGEGPQPGQAEREDPTEQAAWDIWEENRMTQRQGELYVEAALMGDAYAIVWPASDDEARPVIYPQKAAMMTVSYDEDEPGLLVWAAKFWVRDDGYKRANLYFPDRIEKFISRKPDKNKSLPTTVKDFIPYVEEGSPWPEDNPYGRVPVFHFANNAPLGSFGRSELQPVWPLQDALNKTLTDMLVAMEFVSFPQRWATGIEVEVDETTGKEQQPFKPGVDRIWTVADAAAKFGEFGAADLTNFLKSAEFFQYAIARVSSTPLHYLTLITNPPSGESLRVLDSKFVKKVDDREQAFGQVWEALIEFCLMIAGQARQDLKLSTQWEDAAPVSEKDQAETVVVLRKAGLNRRQGLIKLGLKGQQLEEAMKVPEAAPPMGFGEPPEAAPGVPAEPVAQSVPGLANAPSQGAVNSAGGTMPVIDARTGQSARR